MSKFFQAIAWTVLLLAGAAFNCRTLQPCHAQEGNAAVKSPDINSALIDVDQLKLILDTDHDHVRLIEASTSLKKYRAGHIPSAIYVHWLDDMINPQQPELFSNPTRDQLKALMSQRGIGNQHRIIIYDRFASRLSTRLYWTLKFYGLKHVQVLNGGFQAWRSKYEISKKTPNYPGTEFRIAATRAELLAKIDFVKSHLDDPNTVFIDGRPEKQYTGQAPGKIYHTKKQHAKKGHIPGATHVFWKDNFNSDGTFKSVPQLKKLYANAGVRSGNRIVTYCNEGLHAAPPWFVLTELLGHKDVRLYDNSMAEWANGDNPVETETYGDGATPSNSSR
jgi:thiosulfate/3-mercaptopyruvate sulfurtransferase